MNALNAIGHSLISDDRFLALAPVAALAVGLALVFVATRRL